MLEIVLLGVHHRGVYEQMLALPQKRENLKVKEKKNELFKNHKTSGV